jgi:hypothetical protein
MANQISPLAGLALAAALGGSLANVSIDQFGYEDGREIPPRASRPKKRVADPAKKAARKRQKKARHTQRRNP